MSNILRSALAAAVVSVATSAYAFDISGAGATFPYPIYAKWADTYKTETGNGLNYQSIGSGGGIKQIKANTVTFGASDMPLEAGGPDQGRPHPVSHGHRRRSCRSSISKAIEAWRNRSRRPDAGENVPRRDQELGRPGDREAQPDDQAAVDCRSPSSTARTVRARPSSSPSYLSKVSPKWASEVGASTAVQWPAGIGAKGNEGVANNVDQHQGRDRLCRIRLRACRTR